MSRYVPLFLIRDELLKHYRQFGSCTTIPDVCEKLIRRPGLVVSQYKNPFPADSESLSDEAFMELFFQSPYPLDKTKEAIEQKDAFSYLSESLFSKNVLFRVFLHENFAKQGVHEHDFYEITYVFKGQCTMQFGQELVRLNEGNICITPPNTRHEPFVLDESSFVINLSMTEEAFEAAFSVVLLRKDLVSAYIRNILYQQDTQNYLFIPSRNSESMKAAVKHITYENRNDKYYSFSFCISWLSVFMCSVLENYNSDIHLSGNDAKNALQAEKMVLLEYIQNNFRTATLKSVAEVFNYNASYLSRLVQQLTGRSFMEIITDLKLAAGVALMENAELSLEQISEMIGYNSGDYFSKAFKKKYGVPAAEYRRSAQLNGSII